MLTNPGAVSRRGEVDSTGEVLAGYRTVARISDAGQLEGGDVLRIDKNVYVGCATRTDEAGIDELRSHLEPHGYQVIAIRHGAALHLKTACTYLGDGMLLLNPNWVDIGCFEGLEHSSAIPMNHSPAMRFASATKCCFLGNSRRHGHESRRRASRSVQWLLRNWPRRKAD